MRRKAYIIASLICCLLLTACESSTRAYKVDQEFDKYVQEFFTLAKEYGYNFDDQGVIVQFGTVDEGVAAWCWVNRKPIQIDVDKTYWSKLTGPTADDLKRDIIYHEMGHGFLRRQHDNTTLPNGEWMTIMCGGELPDNREPVINFRAMRKPYYIEELFSSDAKTPAWSTYDPGAMEETGTTMINLKATDLKPISTEEIEASVEDGRYKIRNNSSNANIIMVGQSVSTTNDIQYEITLQIVPDDTISSYSGPVFGNIDNTTGITYHYLAANGSNLYLNGEASCVIPFVNNTTTGISKEVTNKLAITHKSDTIYCYQNGKFLYCNDLPDVEVRGRHYAFLIGANTTLYIDNITLRSSTILKNDFDNGIEMRVIPVDNRIRFAGLQSW